MTTSAVSLSRIIKILLLSTLTCQAGSSNFDYFLTHPCRKFVRISNRRHQRTEFIIHNDLFWIKNHPDITNCTFEITLKRVYAVYAALTHIAPVYPSSIESANCSFNVQLLTGTGDRVAEEIACGRASPKIIPWPWNRVVVNFLLNSNPRLNTSISDYMFVISASPINKQLIGRIWTSTKITLPEENGTSICIDSKPFYYYLVYNEHWPYGQINHDVMVTFHIKSDISLCIKSYSLPVSDQCHWNVNIKMNRTQLIRIECMDISDYWCLPWSLKNSLLDVVWTVSGLYNKAAIFSLRVISNNSIQNHEQSICPLTEERGQHQTEILTTSQSMEKSVNNNDNQKDSYKHIDTHVYIVILLMVISLAFLILISLAVKMVRNRKSKGACCTTADERYTESEHHTESHRGDQAGNLVQIRNEADDPPRYTARWTNTSYMEIPNNEQQIVLTVLPSNEVFYHEDPPLYTSHDNLNPRQLNMETTIFNDAPPTYSVHSDHSGISMRLCRHNMDNPPPYEDVCG